MALAFLLGLLAGAFLTGLVLRARRMYWLKAWIAGSLVAPTLIAVAELLQPTGWFGIAVVVGSLYGVAAASVGVAIGWLIGRTNRSDAASQTNAFSRE